MKRILLADDHLIIRLGLIQILRDEYKDAQIEEVSDGDALVKAVKKQDWDIVISDLEMPGMSGLRALEQIKLIRPSLPVLILSMYPDELYGVRVLKAGASGYLNKNTVPYELITALQRIFLGRKYITPEIAEKLIAQSDTLAFPHELLTNKEFEIFKLLALGKTLTQIADLQCLALTTISTHRTRIMHKLNLSTNSDLTRYAITHHLISDI
jgi:two-component system, NarL family, invasion response regulator UvrY